MLPWTALLCAAIVLRRTYALPTDSGSTISSGDVDNPTATISSRDTPSPAFEFYDSCPTSSPNATSKGEAVQKYFPHTCQEVHANGDTIILNWTAAGVDSMAFYSDRLCMQKIIGIGQEGVESTSCFDLSKRPKVLSVQSENAPPEKKREIVPPAATLNSRDDPAVAFGFYDLCPLDAEALYKGGNVSNYKLNSCQEVDAEGDALYINWEAGFDTLSLYEDKNCKDMFDFTFPGIIMDRFDPKYKNEGCYDLKGWPKLLSVQSGNEDWGKREIPPSAATISSTAMIAPRDTMTPPAGPIFKPLTAVEFFDKCPIDLKGNDTRAQSKGGEVKGYISGTCQRVDPPSSWMTIYWEYAVVRTLMLYKDDNCTEADRVHTAIPSKNTTSPFHDTGCIDLSKLPAKVQSFKGISSI